MAKWLASEQQRIANELLQKLKVLPKPVCLALLGEFRMGRPLILQFLCDQLPHPRVYLSLGQLIGAERDYSSTLLYQQIVHGLRANGEADEAAHDPSESETAVGSESWFERALQALDNQPITIILDDVEQLADVSWGEQFFRHFRLVMANVSNIRVVLGATSRILRWVKKIDVGGPVGLWSALVEAPQSLQPIELSKVRHAYPNHEALAKRLIELCGGHPICLKEIVEKMTVPRRRSRSEKLEDVDYAARRLEEEWDNTFRFYWESYDLLTRKLCFLLTLTPDGLQEEELKAKLDEEVEKYEFKQALNALTITAIVFKDEKEKLRLIELFRRWYKSELQPLGFVDNLSATSESKREPPPPTTSSKVEPPTTELTFFPDKDLVLIRRHRFLFTSQFGLERNTLDRIRFATQKLVTHHSGKFFDELKYFSGSLWDTLNGKSWFNQLISSVREKHSLRFNIPLKEMGEFPFELLPFDYTGTKRIGKLVPISRQFIRQGDEIQLPPLILPSAEEEGLRVLIVASEVGGRVVIDPDGDVYIGKESQDREGDCFRVGRLKLEQEVEQLHNILNDHPRVIKEVKVLARNYEEPTAKRFQELLSDPNNQFDILHFAGHGIALPDQPLSGGLLFKDHLVHLSQLEGLLLNQKKLRFIYLSCCESATQSSKNDDLLGLAHTCVQAGVPAVLGMRWPIAPFVSRTLTNTFYPAFFQTGALDQALHAAVQAMDSQQRNPTKKAYAAVPVLIMH